MADKKIYLECQCNLSCHMVTLELFDWDDGPPQGGKPFNRKDVTLNFQLRDMPHWTRRIWPAIKYMFGMAGSAAHWDDTLIKPEDYDKIKQMLDEAKVINPHK